MATLRLLGPNGAMDGSIPSYHLGSGGSKGSGLPNLALIRLAPPKLDARLLKLLLLQPAAIGSILGMLTFTTIVSMPDLLAGTVRTLCRWLLAVWWAGHAAEGCFALYVCLVELKLPLRFLLLTPRPPFLRS